MIRYSLIPPLSIALLCTSLLAACGEESPPPTSSSQPASANAAAAPVAAAPAAAAEEAAAIDSDQWWSALPRAEWSEFEKLETLNPWFEVYQVLDGVYAIYEDGQFEEVISYLIVGERGALLFDTGLGMGDIRSVAKQLTRKNIRVLNSHAHYDHVGGNYQFETIIGRRHPFALERAKGTPNTELIEYVTGDWVWKPVPPDFVPTDYRIRPWEYSNWLRPGEFIDLGGVSLEVIPAPGHSPDSIVLLDANRRLLFTGDTFYLAPLYAHLEGSSLSAYVDTAARLAELADDVDTLLMSHNTPLAESRYLRDLNQAMQAIDSGSAPFTATDGGREYRFNGFSVLTRDPPQDDAPLIDAL
jgi:glyoxylase-like metal-dependent hydrolase (beta-lactamase superfamily II)